VKTKFVHYQQTVVTKTPFVVVETVKVVVVRNKGLKIVVLFWQSGRYEALCEIFHQNLFNFKSLFILLFRNSPGEYIKNISTGYKFLLLQSMLFKTRYIAKINSSSK